MPGGPSRAGGRPYAPPVEAPDLPLAEWLVLALVAEGPVHGFAVAAELAPAGEVGRVYAVGRPVVYRALLRLQAAGLVRPVRTERSAAGPQRTVVEVTGEGRAALDGWLVAPVSHVREVRTELLAKLALRLRVGADLAPLLRAQAEVLRPIVAALDGDGAPVEGLDLVVARWRRSSARAALGFVDDLLAGG